MSAPTVYDGVIGTRGAVFQGKLFWVARRVPDRTKIIKLITDNGGSIKALEKKAEILIADPLRTDGPSEALSWEFVTDSIKYGIKQEEDKYKISQSPAATRPVGYSKPMKGTRTPFTTEDDAALTRWNGRHTWQSWRDRWVKKLSRLPRTTLEKMVAGDDDAAPEAASSSAKREQEGPSVNSKPRASAVKTEVRSPVVTRARPAVNETEVLSQVRPATRNAFTQADDDLLLETCTKAKSRGSTLNEKFFQQLAAKYTRHPKSSWQKRWAEVVGPRARQNPVAEELSQNPPSTTQPASKEKTPVRDEAVRTGRVAGESQIAHNTGSPANEAMETAIEPANPQVVEVQSHAEEGNENEDPHESQELTREYFFGRLKDFRTVMRQDPDVEPQISGRSVDLWGLHEAVRDGYARGRPETDWEDVADTLEFPRDASAQLIDCYNEHIAPFLPTLEGFMVEGSEGSDDEDAEGEDDEENDIHISLPTGLPRASSKRQISCVDTRGPTAPSTPVSRRKRLRLGPDAEIPSTPDDKLGLASPSGFGGSPSLSVKRPEDTPVPAGEARRHEPETQDFAFDEHFRDLGESQDNDESDISPSQQLMGDMESVARIPLSFDKETDNNLARPQTSNPRSSRPNTPNRDEMPVLQADEAAARAPEPGPQAKDEVSDLDRFIKNVQNIDHSYDDILTALMSTSLTPPLAMFVLNHLKEYKSLPKNWEGVWTLRDDERLRRVDSMDKNNQDEAERAKLKRYWDYLVLKHTLPTIEQRRRFFAYMKEQSSQ
ncbi:hypothetical protein C8034_v007141 [Colletotrichum sidae]|uniref:DNA-binding protein RAP1 n=1 Tax=Colletotrichum sidae TaxID=1347389 RepID=A0A4R8T4D2_9PEZI|nr:hypothetical protein C8034_v007141 [Colletotrichum sidae]